MTDVPPSSQTARDDLAFLRALVQSGGGMQQPFGQLYLAGGLCYGAQLLASALDSGLIWPRAAAVSITIAVAPTLVFGAIMAVILWRNRRIAPPAGTQRAVAQVFRSLGLTNLALIVVIGAVAWRERSGTTWLIYPCCVFVLQGAAWLVAHALRRRPWMLLVASGWFVSATAMAVFIEDIPLYIAAAGAGLILFMALPGWLILRGSRLVAG